MLVLLTKMSNQSQPTTEMLSLTSWSWSRIRMALIRSILNTYAISDKITRNVCSLVYQEDCIFSFRLDLERGNVVIHEQTQSVNSSANSLRIHLLRVDVETIFHYMSFHIVVRLKSLKKVKFCILLCLITEVKEKISRRIHYYHFCKTLRNK